MLRLICILSALGAMLSPVVAQSVEPLSSEEVQLIQLFRSNPDAFRAFVAQLPDTASTPAVSVIGPRDIVDVTIMGGQVAFYGKRHAYEPVAFRIARGEQKTIVVTRDGRPGTETEIVVAFRIDGLHFDIPKAYGNSRVPPRGGIVIPEDKRWRSGEPIPFKGELHADTKSEAIGLVFQMRYAVAR